MSATIILVLDNDPGRGQSVTCACAVCDASVRLAVDPATASRVVEGLACSHECLVLGQAEAAS